MAFLNLAGDPVLTAYGSALALKHMLGLGGTLPTSLYLGLIAPNSSGVLATWSSTDWAVREFQSASGGSPAYAPNYARVTVPSWSAPAIGGLIVPPNSWYATAGPQIGVWSRIGADITFPAPPLPDDYATGGTPWPAILGFGLWDAATGGNLIWILRAASTQTRWANLGSVGTTYSHTPSHSNPLVIPALDPGGYPNVFVGFNARGLQPNQSGHAYNYGTELPDPVLFQTSPTGLAWPDAFYMGLTDSLTGRAAWTPPSNYYFGFYSYLTKTPWTANGYTPVGISWNTVDAVTLLGQAVTTNSNDFNWTFTGDGPQDVDGNRLPLIGAIYDSSTPASDDSNTLVRVPVVHDDISGSVWNSGSVSGDTLKLAAGKMGIRLF
jgi:hypothetical protein